MRILQTPGLAFTPASVQFEKHGDKRKQSVKANPETKGLKEPVEVTLAAMYSMVPYQQEHSIEPQGKATVSCVSRVLKPLLNRPLQPGGKRKQTNVLPWQILNRG